MPYTREQLVQAVAAELDRAPDGQPVEPDDGAKIRDALPGIVADLDARGMFAFPDLDAIPDAAFQHLAGIAAGALTGRFGIDESRAAELAAKRIDAEQKLRRITALPPSYAPVRASYF